MNVQARSYPVINETIHHIALAAQERWAKRPHPKTNNNISQLIRSIKKDIVDQLGAEYVHHNKYTWVDGSNKHRLITTVVITFCLTKGCTSQDFGGKPVGGFTGSICFNISSGPVKAKPAA